LNRLFGILLAMTTVLYSAAAQSSSAKNVRVSSKVLDGTVKPGSTFRAEVKLTIARGWHINSHMPSQEYMIGTTLELDSTAGYSVSDIQYPCERSVKLSISETPFSLYDGTVTIVVTLKASADVPKGKSVLKGKLTFQACNDKICVAPSTVPVSIPVTVES
jgi:thiol:disulfide interchange protein DsbD